MNKVLFSGFFMMAWAGTVAAENILDNGDFESDLKNWAAIRMKEPAGTVVDTVSYGGKKSLCLYREGDKSNYFYRGIILKKDVEYKLSGAVKCDGADEKDISIRILALKPDKSGKYKPFGWIAKYGVNNLIITGGTHDWKDFSAVITRDMIPEGVEKCTLIVERKNNGKGKIYLDDLTIEPMEK